jgi:bifunctional non-homologous end joining protein LigD
VDDHLRPPEKGRLMARSKSRPTSPVASPPKLIAPCLATLVNKPPSGTGWLHEIKWDGYRLIACVARGKVVLRTRRGLDWTPRFPTIASAIASLPMASAVLDGEAVVENEQGLPDFSALQAALGVRSAHGHRGYKAAPEAVYYAFDLLWLKGEDLRERTLEERRSALEALLIEVDRSAHLRLSEEVTGDGPTVLRHACAMGLEGIISKRRDWPYRSGRVKDWLKSKCTSRQEFVITGYLLRGDNARAVGALVAGYFDGRLTYAGRVGTGFTADVAQTLFRTLQPLRSTAPGFAKKLSAADRKGVVWVRPELVAEVEFRGWTSDGLLRAAAFKGLREDKDAREIVREEAAIARVSSPPEQA